METENNMNRYDDRVGFGRRFGAYLLDLLIAMVFGGVVAVFVGEELVQAIYGTQLEEMDAAMEVLANSDINFDFGGFMLKSFAYSAGITLVIIIFFILEGALGQSPGKMLLQIINTNVDGSQAEPAKLWLRAALKYGSTLLSLIGGLVGLTFIASFGSLWGFIIFVGFFFAFADKKQTFHDMIAKTVVIRK